MSRGRRWAIPLALVTILAGCVPISGPSSSRSGASGGSVEVGQSSSGRPDAVFPAEVGGMPVVTVARADELLRAGKLDGRAIAVAGYFGQFLPACPMPGRYIGPLEGWCMFVAFADSSGAARLCHPEGSNGVGCSITTATHLQPFFVTETGGNPWQLAGNAAQEPVPLVLIGHSGDGRRLQCPSTSRDECARAFVVDRVAWANGHDVPLAAAQTGNQQTGAALTPRLSLDQVVTAAALGDRVTAAGAFRAGDVATIDPRWNFAGDNLMWVVRALEPAANPTADEARPETVWLVDDTTGKVLDSHPAAVDPAYQPAQLWRTATAYGIECCGTTPTMAFDRIQADDGTVVYEGLVSGGSSGGEGYTTFGGGYGSQLLVLPAGGYAIRTWLASYDDGAMGEPRQACTTHLVLKALDSITVDARFPDGEACTSGPAPAPTPLF